MVSLKYIHSFFHFEKQLKADPKQNNAGFLFKTKQNWRVSRKEQKTFLVKKSLELVSMVSFFWLRSMERDRAVIPIPGKSSLLPSSAHQGQFSATPRGSQLSEAPTLFAVSPV